MSLYVLVVYPVFFLIHVRPITDSVFNRRPLLAADGISKPCPELQANNAEDAFDIFSENLRHPNKDVRLMTLRILCHFEPMKKLKTEVVQKSSSETNVSRYL